MTDWSISLDKMALSSFSAANHKLVSIDEFFCSPDSIIGQASLQKFAKINPQYPGVRAPLDIEAVESLTNQISPMLSKAFNEPEGTWSIQAWYSIVTYSPDKLLPIQRFPHVDGTDPRQIAMMAYLHHTDHGGTAFFRHKSTGFEALGEDEFPKYRQALQSEVAQTGLPPACYVTDGSPLFELVHQVPGRFNEAVFYRGNILHSGIINNEAPLSVNPREGRLTVNAFLRPPVTG